MVTGSKWIGPFLAMSLVMAACSAESAPLTLDEYVAALQQVESEFDETARTLADRDQYPVAGDLAFAGALYVEFEARLAGWRSIEPPTALERQHVELVDALEVVQTAVGKYLAESATETADFDFDTIGPKMDPLLSEATAACRRLGTAIRDLGARVTFADDCNI